MNVALFVVGIVVLIFGALVLLRFPEKPGGTISIAGVRVSSASAGLPLMVLGVVLVVLAAQQGSREGSTRGQASPARTDPGRSAPNPAVAPTGCAKTNGPTASPSPAGIAQPGSGTGSGAMSVMCDPQRTSSETVVTLRVEDILQKANSLEIYLRAENKGDAEIVLPTSAFSVKDTQTGRIYAVDQTGAVWPQVVPPGGGRITGMIPIAEPLDPNARQLDIGFNRILSPSGSLPDQYVSVDHVDVRSR